MDPISSDPIEEREDDMSSLAAGFAMRMCKWAANAYEETILGFEVSGGKSSRRSDSNEEAHKSPGVITMDSPERAFDALPALEGAAQDASKEACASLEDGALAGNGRLPRR